MRAFPQMPCHDASGVLASCWFAESDDCVARAGSTVFADHDILICTGELQLTNRSIVATEFSYNSTVGY